MNKILEPVAVASRTFSKHPVLRREMQERFAAVLFNDEGKSLGGAELVKFLDGKTGAILALEKLGEEVLSELPGLKVISKYGVGLDNLDLTVMEKRGVKLGWTGGVNARSVSELALGLMLSCLREIPAHTSDLKGGTWKQLPGRTLSGKTVGIIGVGFIGKDLMRLLQPFGCRVLANDLLDVTSDCRACGAEAATFDRVLSESDLITVHVPYSDENRNLIGTAAFARMKEGVIVINTARGGIVDEEALLSALNSGKIRAAGMDVYRVEPPGDSALLRHPRVVGTPHVGGSSEEAILAMGRAAIGNLASLLSTIHSGAF